jgi:hypothetical protein
MSQFTPAPLTVKPISERRENDMDFLTYEATLPVVPPNTDITKQDLVLVVDHVVQPTIELPVDAKTVTFEVPQDSHVVLTFRYIDDAGNSSADTTQEFDAKDTIAPDAPGNFGEIKVVSERTVPDA